MPIKVTELDPLATPDDADVVPIDDVSVPQTKAITIANLRAAMGGGSGSGDVVGPASAVDNAIARHDGPTGKLIQSSPATIDDAGNIATPGTVDGVDVSALGTTVTGINTRLETLEDTENGAIMYPVGPSPTDRQVLQYTDMDGLTWRTPQRVATSAATSYAPTKDDDGKLIRFTSAAAVLVTVPTHMGAGVQIEFVQEAAGAVTVEGTTAGLGMTLIPAGPHVTDGIGSSIVVTTLDTLNARVVVRPAASAGGSGDVVGPASATDNAIARYDGTTGKLLQNGAVTIDDSGNIAGVGTVDGRDVSVDGAKLDTLAPTTIETLAGTSDTLANADNGKVVRCTSASATTITVPSGLTAGVTVEYYQEGAGQITIVGSGLTLRHPATYGPATNEQNSSIVVTILDGSNALVRGDLAAA